MIQILVIMLLLGTKRQVKKKVRLPSSRAFLNGGTSVAGHWDGGIVPLTQNL